jgi:hypothetical protein
VRHAVAALLLFASPLAAQQDVAQKSPAPATPHRFAWVLGGSLEFGGDELIELTFTDGSKQKIYAGQGGTFSVGADFRSTALPNLGVRALAGVKFTTTAAEDADISFTRFPITVVASYYLPQDWRLGAGVAYHTGVSFNGDGFVPDVTFDATPGATLELGWRWAALTYTTMEYSANGVSLDASAIGVSFNWLFGKR